jgi:2-polyprenyl-6-hydroxyphenyl methylase/3-demethylubiquinone-9 3-methyltransferase
MLRLTRDESWPESWKQGHSWDELELWGSRRDLGYSYQYRIRREWALHAIEELVPAGGCILDVAGASGNFTLPLAERGYHVVWNDLRPEMAELVKRKYEFGEIEFSPGNVFDFASEWVGRFDGVLAAEIIEHVAHPDRFLVCLAGMLKPGGRLFLTTPNGRYFLCNNPRFSDCPDPSVYEAVQFRPNADGHIFLLDCDECRSLAAAAGLTVERIALMTNPLTRGHVKLGHLLPYLPAGLVGTIEAGTEKLPRVLREKIHSQTAAVLRKPTE